MKKLIITAASFATLVLATPAFASEGGSCHFHSDMPAKQAAVIDCANQRKNTLAGSGKIDAAWKVVKHNKIEQVDGKKGKEWKVTFKDPAAKDKAKETLFVFFSLPGNFIAANFVGQ